MQTRKLGWTDLELTTIGLGTWAIGGGRWAFSWGPQDEKDSITTIRRALELGINWIDTAAVYGLGCAEQVVGEAIKGLDKRPIVATKCERVWDKVGRISGSLKKKSVQAEADKSLSRLGVDVIDLYQIHWPQPDEEIEEGWTTIAGLIKKGKVRYAGVSNFNVEQMKRCQAIHPIASLQPPYSMVKREAENEVLDYCAANKIGVIAYSPMQKGLLTGKVTPDWVQNLPADDHRRRDPMFRGPQLLKYMDLVQDLRPIADRHEKTLAQLAVAWVLRRPEITAAIVGARKPDQIAETIEAGDWVLPDEIVSEIEDLLRRLRIP